MFTVSPAKPAATGVKRVRTADDSMASDANATHRAKRVRTGCLTCRERHLKCDEGTPDCLNCRKSRRICKRGVRLNFIDIQMEQPPVMPISREWNVHFQDESRDIASEYAGGVNRYAPFVNTATPVRKRNSPPMSRSNPTTSARGCSGSRSSAASAATSVADSHPTTLPALIRIRPDLPRPETSSSAHDPRANSHNPVPPPTLIGYEAPSVAPQQQQQQQQQNPRPPSRSSEHSSQLARETRRYLDNPEETLFMQVFVEEVGIWMDSLDPLKHFSRLLPFTSLGEPMLLNAFLACGARHLTLVNPAYHEDKALYYYDTATRLILASLQCQSRDTEMCATTATILNVYEIMSERPLQRMDHIAGARALLKECGWDGRTGGVGGACFWLNVTMELLSCLRFGWAVAWDPDEWGVDMDFNRQNESGGEALWAHRIINVLAKITNFRAAAKREAEFATPEITQKCYDEWQRLRDLCVSWNEQIPRNMHPMAYLHPYQTANKSSFPEVWLIKRCAVVARLFYHTAMMCLAQTNPFSADGMPELALVHAHQICGIVAHVKDRGVASVALRSLASAAECLVDRREQEEVLEIFDKIQKETGWRIGFLGKELKEKWGWEAPPPPQLVTVQLAALQNPTPQQQYSRYPPQQQQRQRQQQQIHSQQLQLQSRQQPSRRLPVLVNPLMAATDLTHPYHPHYLSVPQQQQQQQQHDNPNHHQHQYQHQHHPDNHHSLDRHHYMH